MSGILAPTPNIISHPHQQLVETALAGISAGFTVIDRDWRITFVNDSIARMAGTEKAQLLGRNVWDLFPDLVGTTLYIEMHRALEQHTPAHFEFHYAPLNLWSEHRVYPYQTGLAIFSADMTERKRAEQALQSANETLEKQAKLLDLAHDAILVRDVDGSITFWNLGAEQTYGWSKNEAIGKTIHGLLQIQFPEPFEEVERKLLNNGWWEGELVHACRDGSRITVASRQVSQRDEHGQPIAVLEINRDITQHKQAEQDLQSSEARLRALVESMDDIAFEIDERGTYLNVWTANRGLLARPKKELIGSRLSDVMGEDFARPFLDAFSRVLATDRPENIEYAVDLSQGKRWFSGRISPIRSENSGQRSLCLLVREITDHKQAEEERKESEERLRLLVECVKDYAIFMLDPEGHILSWNLGAERIKGYQAAEIIGKHFSIFYPREDVCSGKPERLLRIAAAEGRSEDQGWRLRKDGSRFWADVVITALYDMGRRLQGFSKVTRDITERKRAEESLRELSGRLLAAQDEERRRLARELHDSTAQTLSALSLNLALLVETARPALDERAAQALAESVDLADQAARELRNFSYLLHPPLVDQAGLAEALRSYVNGFTQRTGVEVDLELRPPEFDRLPQEMETALFRVIQECLTNTHRHSGSKLAGVRLIQGSDAITLQVWDEGKGLSAETAESSQEPPPMGVGIQGMHERVRQLGGRMEIRSGNPGTLIEVVLPAGSGTSEPG